MDLDDDTPTQLRGLSTWMKDLAAKESPPSALEWAAITKGLRARADFLDRYVLPEIEVDKFAMTSKPTYIQSIDRG